MHTEERPTTQVGRLHTLFEQQARRTPTAIALEVPMTRAALADLLGEAIERTGLDDIAAMVSAPPLAALLGATAAAVVANRVRVPAIGIRASDLRAAVAAGGSIRYRTPRAVERYIESHGLYRGQ